ncbi:CDP-alcohol phosphatidyltransferase family protein [bacterium]|nr:CDP-alcohol phosphatidyltransferase family protein [bacterium]
MSARAKAWSVHLFTASGVVAGVVALERARLGDLRGAFLWMMIAVFIDSVDGTLARRWQVSRYAPEIDGRRLDDMVDYFTWVLLPVLAMFWWGWLPPLVWAAPLLSSALGMANSQAKTDDDYFLGFPSLWNVVALYLWRWNLPVALNGAIVLTLSLCVLLPIRFVYPSKTRRFRSLSMILMSLWGALVLFSLSGSGPLHEQSFLWSNFFPVYYLGLSFWLHSQDKPDAARSSQEPGEERVQ